MSIARNDPTGRQMGLLTDSVIVTDNLATVLEREIDRAIGACPIMDQVDAALKLMLDLCRRSQLIRVLHHPSIQR